jgi:WD40 repeat protein/serine/threonine protein kinase
MRPESHADEAFLLGWPLPLAQLGRRARNAKSALERHLAAFYLWEAALKLLGSACVVGYARLGSPEEDLAACLENMARPALGHWWEFVRRLVPVLADRGVAGFGEVRDVVLGRRRDDLPRAAGLDAVLREVLEGKKEARAAVYPAELFDRLVQYRNREIGHGAAGARGADFYERVGQSLLLAARDLFGKLDVLAGRRLVYVAEVRQVRGAWRVERYQLSGEAAQRLEPLELAREQAADLPDGERVYLEAGSEELTALHPLVVYDAEANECAFLSARRGKAKAEYLCYTSGRTSLRPDLGGEQRALLARALGLAEVSEEQARVWAARSQGDEPAEEPAPGPVRRTLGEFELLSELGRGGMGVVYRAWQPSLGRQVAVKALLAQQGDPRAEARFRREIRALGQVEHPHVVKVFSSGSDGEQWFYVMELVEGAPLSAVCGALQTSGGSVTEIDLPVWRQAVGNACAEARRGEKPLGDVPTLHPAAPTTPESPPAPGRGGRGYVRQVVVLMRQVAEALEALHRHGIVHRDVKPGNVLVDAAGGHATLMDLGLAQVADDVEGKLTRTRQFVGTLRYASPEQVRAVAPVDSRSDVYSLGATLWELLALRPLFGATESTPIPELMQTIEQDEPQRLRQCHPGVGRDLEAVVHKCLEKKPARRYQTAREVAEDLGRWLDGEPVRARPVGWLDRKVKWVRRHPKEAAAYGLGVLVALLLLIGGGFGWLWHQAEEARGDAVKARQAAEQAHDDLAREKRKSEGALQGKVDAEHQAAEARRKELEAERKAGEVAQDLIDRFNDLQALRLAQQFGEAGDLRRVKEEMESIPERRRGWEWFYVKAGFFDQAAVLEGHTQIVSSVCFSPDGRRLASGSDDVVLWDVATGRPARTLRGHAGGVKSVAFSPDGRRLASDSRDNTVVLWDVETGRPARTLRGHTDDVNSVAFSPDGRRLASGSQDKTVVLWDLDSGRPARTLRGHAGPVTSVSFSPDGRRLASGSRDNTVVLWDVETGRPARTLRGHTDDVRSVAFSPDGRRLASGSDDTTVVLWDLESGRPARTLRGHADWFRGGTVQSVSFSPDGRHLASGSGDKTVVLWDLDSGRPARTLRGHSDWVQSVAFSPDGRRLASGSQDKTVVLWDLDSGRPARTLRGHTGLVTSVAFSPDGRRLASGSWDMMVVLWDLDSGRPARTLEGHAGFVNSVAFSPDGRRLASASEDGTVVLWDLDSGRPARTLIVHAGWVKSGLVTSVAFSPDGRRLASASTDTTVVLWDLDSGQPAHTLKGHADSVTSVAFSPDGRRLASGSDDGTVVLWDTNNRHLWHLREASDAEREGRWEDAAWFLEACLHRETALRADEALSGTSSPLPVGAAATLLALRQREGRVEVADLLERHHRACLGAWRSDQAEADFRRLRAAQGDTPAVWHRRAWGMLHRARRQEILLAAAESAAAAPPCGFGPWSAVIPLWPRRADTRAFRRVCDEMAERFAEPKDAATADWLAWTRLLVGDGLDAAQKDRLEKLAKFAVDSAPDDRSFPEAYGAALYRAGKFPQAVQHLKVKKEDNGGSVWQQMFLAMAHHRLGNDQEARDWLTKAARQIEKNSKERHGWEDEVVWHYLREEAETTLGWRVPPEAGPR